MDNVFYNFHSLVMECHKLNNGSFKEKIKGFFSTRKLKRELEKYIDNTVIDVFEIKQFASMYKSTEESIVIEGIELVEPENPNFESLVVINMREDRRIALGYKNDPRELFYLSLSIGYDGINFFNGDKIVFKNEGKMLYNGNNQKKIDIIDIVSDLLKDIFKQYVDMYMKLYL